jgi:hypothetical protein
MNTPKVEDLQDLDLETEYGSVWAYTSEDQGIGLITYGPGDEGMTTSVHNSITPDQAIDLACWLLQAARKARGV